MTTRLRNTTARNQSEAVGPETSTIKTEGRASISLEKSEHSLVFLLCSKGRRKSRHKHMLHKDTPRTRAKERIPKQ